MRQKKMSESLHIAFLGRRRLFLKKTSAVTFEWQDEEGVPLLYAGSVEEAIRLLNHRFKEHPKFRLLLAGKRFTLPERDEHGSPALFYHLVASQKTANGIYFDEELSCSCIVKEASLEALSLTRSL